MPIPCYPELTEPEIDRIERVLAGRPARAPRVVTESAEPSATVSGRVRAQQ